MMLQHFRQVIRRKLLDQNGNVTPHNEDDLANNTNDLDWNESSISESPDSNSIDITKDAELIPVMSPKSKQAQTKVSTFFMKKNIPNDVFSANKTIGGQKNTENSAKTIANSASNKQLAGNSDGNDAAVSVSKTSPSKKSSNQSKTFSFLSQMVRSPSQISFQIDADLARIINVLNKSSNKRTIRDCELVGSAIRKTNFFKEYECVLNDPLKLTQLVAKLKYTYFNPYQALILEGESSRKMYILMKGSVWMLVRRREGYAEIENRVKELIEQAEKLGEKEPTCYVDAEDYVQFKHKELKILSTIQSPDVIGDTELRQKTNRCISVVTKTTVHLATIDYYDFNEIFMPQTEEEQGQHQQSQPQQLVPVKNSNIFSNNKQISQESIFPLDKTLLLFESNHLFHAFSKSLLHIILRYSQTQNLCRSQIIYNQVTQKLRQFFGGENAEYVYFIEEGEVELKQKHKNTNSNDANTPRKLIEQIERDQKQELLLASCKHRHKDTATKSESERYVAVLGPGEVFGEDFLKGESYRLHTAICKSVKLKVYKIAVSMLKELLLSKGIDLSMLDIKSQWREQLKSTARVIEQTFENPKPNEVEFKMMKRAADQFLLANPYSVETNLNNTFNIPSEINSFMKMDQEKNEKNNTIVKSASLRCLNTTGCLEEKVSWVKEGINRNNQNNNSMIVLNSTRSLALKSSKNKDAKNTFFTDTNLTSSPSFLPISSSQSRRPQFPATTGQLFSLDTHKAQHNKSDLIDENPHSSGSSSFSRKQSKPFSERQYFFESQSARHHQADCAISPIKQLSIATEKQPTTNTSSSVKFQFLNESHNSGNSSIAVISPEKSTGQLPKSQQRRSSQNYFFPEKHNPNDTWNLKTPCISNCSTSRQIPSRQQCDGSTEISKHSSQYHAYFPDLRRISTPPITSFERLSEQVPNKSSNFKNKNKRENENITSFSSEQAIHHRVPQIALETLTRRKSKNLGVNRSYSNSLNGRVSDSGQQQQRNQTSVETKNNKDNKIVAPYGYSDTIGGEGRERILVRNESYLKELSRKLKDVKISRLPAKKNTHFNPFKLGTSDDSNNNNNSSNPPAGNSTSYNTVSSRVQVFRQLNLDTIFPDSAYGIEAKQGLARINTLLEQTHEQEIQDRNVERLRKKLPAMINDQISADDAKQTIAQQQQLFSNSNKKMKSERTMKINKSEKDLIDGMNGNTDSKVYIKLLLGKIQKEDKLNSESDYNFIGKQSG